MSQHNVSYIKQKSQKMFDNKRIPTYVMPKQGWSLYLFLWNAEFEYLTSATQWWKKVKWIGKWKSKVKLFWYVHTMKLSIRN